jgi:hypothetical protein
MALISLMIVTGLESACSGPQPSSSDVSIPSPSSSSSATPYWDAAPRELIANYGPGIGGEMACSTGQVVFTDGPMHAVYATSIDNFQPRLVANVEGAIGPISMFGSWAAFSTPKLAIS